MKLGLTRSVNKIISRKTNRISVSILCAWVCVCVSVYLKSLRLNTEQEEKDKDYKLSLVLPRLRPLFIINQFTYIMHSNGTYSYSLMYNAVALKIPLSYLNKRRLYVGMCSTSVSV